MSKAKTKAEKKAKFTQAKAEKAGWVFVHSKPEESEHIADGVVRTIPASLRAEKYVTTGLGSSKLISEYGETEAQLLARIEAYENHLASFEQPEPEVSEKQEDKREAEDGRAGEEKVETEQLVVESPRRTGEVVTVRKGEKSPDEAQARKDAEEAELESERVNAALEAQDALKAEEEAQGEDGSED